MSPGSHAAGDGSFGRSAGIQAGRAALLIGVAVLIGVLILHRGAAPAEVTVGRTTLPGLTDTTVGGNTGGTGSTGGTGGTTGTTRPSVSTAPLRATTDVKVLVANGTSTTGLAGRVSNTLHSKGYNTLASTNSTARPPTTIVYFEPGFGADAMALEAKLGLSNAVLAMPVPPPVPVLNGADILVVAGPDLVGTGSTTSTT